MANSGAAARKPPVAPPVYRPQPVPKVLQRKQAGPNNVTPNNVPRTQRQTIGPPAPRPHSLPVHKSVMQAKPATSPPARRTNARPPASPSSNAIQRLILFTHGSRLKQNNVAESIANMVDYGITKTTLNGAAYPGGTKENFVSAMLAPTLGVEKGSLGGAAVYVQSVPTQQVSYIMELPTNGPWQLRVGAANIKVKLANQPIVEGLGIPIGSDEAGDLTLDVRGLPTDAAFANLVETHEDVHVADIQTAIEEILKPWDARLSRFRNLGTRFEGMSQETATARLYQAAGGTPREIADRFVMRLRQMGMIFHNTDAGKAPSIVAMGRGGSGNSVLEVYMKHRAGLVALHEHVQEQRRQQAERDQAMLARGISASLSHPVTGSIQGPNGNAYINNDML